MSFFDSLVHCRVCGCTDVDCSGCVERTGEPCSWVEADLCSACSAHAPGDQCRCETCGGVVSCEDLECAACGPAFVWIPCRECDDDLRREKGMSEAFDDAEDSGAGYEDAYPDYDVHI